MTKLCCSKCNKNKQEDEFYRNAARSTGRRSHCKVCEKKEKDARDKKLHDKRIKAAHKPASRVASLKKVPQVLYCNKCKEHVAQNKFPDDKRFPYRGFKGYICNPCRATVTKTKKQSRESDNKVARSSSAPVTKRVVAKPPTHRPLDRLKCSRCSMMKEDAAFPRSASVTTRRGRNYWCRDCFSKLRIQKKKTIQKKPMKQITKAISKEQVIRQKNSGTTSPYRYKKDMPDYLL